MYTLSNVDGIRMAKFLLMPRIPLKHAPEEPRLTDGNDFFLVRKMGGNSWQDF